MDRAAAPLILATALLSGACDRQAGDGKSADTVGVQSCDELLENLTACAKKHPEAQEAHDTMKEIFLRVARDDERHEELKGTCEAQRRLMKSDFADCSF